MIAHFDCFAGASGDMLVGALLDCGVDRTQWLSQVQPLVPDHWRLTSEKINKQGIASTKFSVWQNGRLAEDPHVVPAASHIALAAPHDHDQVHGHAHSHVHHHHHDHSHRTLPEVLDHLGRARLTPSAHALAEKVFLLLADSEALVHGVSVDTVHFHEVGATDAVIDIAGFAAAFDALNIEKAVVSPLVTGSGTVRTSHGVLPVPPPVVLEIIRRSSAPVRASDIPFEALTPTGAAILCTIANAYGPLPQLKHVSAVGYGAGTRDGAGMPNVLRVTIGESV